MDNITPLKPATADAAIADDAMANTQPPTEPTHEPTVQPLNLVEDTKVRSKLRLYAILIALYVRFPVSAFKKNH